VCHLHKGDDPSCDFEKQSLVALWEAMAQNRTLGDTTWGGQHIWETVSILRAWRPSVRYEDNPRSAVPEILYQVAKHLMTMTYENVVVNWGQIW